MISFSTQAQNSDTLSRMNITLRQTAESTSESPVDYSARTPSSSAGNDVLVHTYTHERASFAGGTIQEFPAWIANQLVKTMDRDEAYSVHLTVDFIVTDDGKVKDVNVRARAGKSLNEVESLLVEEINNAGFWYPETHYGTKFSTPMSLTVSASAFVPNNGIIFVETYGDDFFNATSARLDSKNPKIAM